MTIHSGGTLTSLTTHLQMLPSEPQPLAKRKGVDESNPLLAAQGRRSKKEGRGNAKRKLRGAEEQPGGLLIVRTVPSSTVPQPPQSSSQQQHPFAPQRGLTLQRQLSQPPLPPQNHFLLSDALPNSSHQSIAGPSKPPNKKFRADSQPPISTTQVNGSRTSQQSGNHSRDTSLSSKNDSRDDRFSRIPTVMDSSTDPLFQFSTTTSRSNSMDSRTKGKNRASMGTELIVPLPEHDTPQMERNRRLRDGPGWGEDSDQRGRGSGKESHRRKSSLSRGKRISTSFENSGVIAHPHTSVSDSSFFKHIDAELPNSERVRQLLIWCTSRAAAQIRQETTSTHELGAATLPRLPLLSKEASEVFKAIQEDTLRFLAEKKVDLSSYAQEGAPPGSSGSSGPLRENKQNVANRGLAVTYGGQIQRAEQEEESWKQLSASYDAYAKKLRASVEKRSQGLKDYHARLEQLKRKVDAPSDDPANSALLDLEEMWKPTEASIPDEFRRGWTLIQSVLGNRPRGEERLVGAAGKVTDLGTQNSELQQEIKRRLPDVEYELDRLEQYTSSARATVSLAEKFLDQRFAVLSNFLITRSNPPQLAPPLPAPDSGSASSTGAHTLTTYISNSSTILPSSSGSASASSAASSSLRPTAETRMLFRALSRVDTIRPPEKIGDAVRRATREVQRFEESGLPAVGERRITMMPGVPHTPRKAPPTPRRTGGTTPGRDRDR